MNHSEYVLETNNISKTYGSVNALQAVTLRFSKEKIYGLFGRNGAGKTTFLDIISSRTFADDGTVTCLGEDILKNPGVIADNCCYMPEKHYFPARFKVLQLLSFGKKLFPNYDEMYAHKLCIDFNLNIQQKYGQLSRGHQSVFRIILGLAAQSPITIFDEPVLGLDAVARDKFYGELIEEFSRHPRLFIIATHLIEESADLYNEAIIIRNGKVIRQAPVEELLSHVFYVSGKTARVNEFLLNREVINHRELGGIKMAVVVGDMNKEKEISGLSFSLLTIQKLFIHLTNDDTNQEKTV